MHTEHLRKPNTTDFMATLLQQMQSLTAGGSSAGKGQGPVVSTVLTSSASPAAALGSCEPATQLRACCPAVQTAPGSVALVVACEPITLGMAPSNDPDCVSNLSLMRTGAAAVLLTNRCGTHDLGFGPRAPCVRQACAALVQAVAPSVSPPPPSIFSATGYSVQARQASTHLQTLGLQRNTMDKHGGGFLQAEGPRAHQV